MPGAQPTPAGGSRPPVPGMFPRGDGTMQFDQQKSRMPSMGSSPVSQSNDGEQKSVDTKFQELADTEKKVLFFHMFQSLYTMESFVVYETNFFLKFPWPKCFFGFSRK